MDLPILQMVSHDYKVAAATGKPFAASQAAQVPSDGRGRSCSCARQGSNRLFTFAPLLILFTALGFAFNAAIGVGQPAMGNSVKGFKAPLEYWDPPHELQVKSYLEGSESEMGSNGTVILRDARLQTFHEDGSPEMVVDAPRCLYDYSGHIVHSDGPLKMRMWDADSKHTYEVRGTNGFYWQQTNSYVVVSNGQITIISGSLTNSFIP